MSREEFKLYWLKSNISWIFIGFIGVRFLFLVLDLIESSNSKSSNSCSSKMMKMGVVVRVMVGEDKLIERK